MGEGLPVWSVARHRLIRVDDADDAAPQGNGLALQSVGVSSAVEPLMATKVLEGAESIADTRGVLRDPGSCADSYQMAAEGIP